MPKFPWPPDPAALAAIPPDTRTLRTGTLLARIYPRGGRYPTSWSAFRWDGPLASARFDHHAGGERRGVLYGATDLITCIAEVFQGSRVVDRTSGDRFLTAFQTACPLPLLDLTADWPTRAGASQAIASGPRHRAQAWARAIYDAYPAVHGLRYASSMHGGHVAVVLWERSGRALPPAPELDIPLSHPGLLPDLIRAANSLGYLLR